MVAGGVCTANPGLLPSCAAKTFHARGGTGILSVRTAKMAVARFGCSHAGVRRTYARIVAHRRVFVKPR